MSSKYNQIPPGLSLSFERRLFLSALSGTSLLSVIFFYIRYSQARQALFMQVHPTKVLIPGAVISDFSHLLHHVLTPLFLLMLLMPVFVVLHYLHYRRGSMSIYLMRRLPNRRLLHQQCWTVPLLGLGLCMLVTLLLLVLFLLIYMYATPSPCLPSVYRRF